MGQISFQRVILSFVISTLIFISVFMISYWVVLSKYQGNLATQQQIWERMSFIYTSNITDCNDYLTNISIELDKAGAILGILEERMGKNNPDVIFLKEDYSLLELEHLYNIKKYIKQCNEKITTILFFYSNKDKYLDDAETKGYILSKVKKDNPKKVMIYSFDYDLNTEPINNLKEVYHIRKPNVIVIDEQMIIEHFNDIDDIKQYV